MTRLLFITPAREQCGSEQQLPLLLAALPRDDWDVHVATLDDGPLVDSLQAMNVPVTVLRQRWERDFRVVWQLRTLLRELRPDIVHTWRPRGNLFGRLAAIRERTPFVVAERASDESCSWWEAWVDRWLERRTDRFVAREAAVGPRDVVIPAAVAPAIPPTNESRADLLTELQLPARSRLIGAIGGLHLHCGHKEMIWATDLLKCVHAEVHLLIVGDGPLRWRLERYRDQLRLRDRVHFLGDRPDVLRIVSHCDCCWIAGSRPGQQHAALCAMAAGVPIVATDIPARRGLLLGLEADAAPGDSDVPQEAGLLVPIGDRGELARATHRLLEDSALAQRIGAAGRARAMINHAPARIAARYVDLYRAAGNNPTR